MQGSGMNSATNFQVAFDFNGTHHILNATGYNSGVGQNPPWTSYSLTGTTTHATGNSIHFGGSSVHTGTTQMAGFIRLRNITLQYVTPSTTTVAIGSTAQAANLNVTGTLTVGGSAVQEAIPGFSLSPTILVGPTNNPTLYTGSSNWVLHSSGTYATLSVGTGGTYDAFANVTFLANETATVTCEVKLP